jgi:hypothetical protein
MSGLTQNTLARIDKWLSYGTSIETAFPKLEQRYRMQICSEFYKRWVQNKDIDPRTVCRNIARRDYEMFFNQAAQSNKEAQEYVLALKITLDDEGNICPRTVTELNNDVLVCNHLIRFFQTDESPRHKAMYLSSAEWLIRTGKQQNNDRAVDKGMQALANVYGNFQEEKDATDEMPDMSRIAITQDVSIVKRDRVNYTEEEKLRMARKYGLTTKDLQEIEDETGVGRTKQGFGRRYKAYNGSDTAEDTATSCWQQVCSRPPSPILHARTDPQGHPYVAECPQRHSRS